MSRVFWDTMLLIYLLEGNEDNAAFRKRADELLARSFRRRDALFTSYLALGEMMAGVEKSKKPQLAGAVEDTLRGMGFTFLAFDEKAVSPFSKLRAGTKLKAPDAIHLACAASAGIDLYLTGDTQLFRLDVPGIQFIADFNSPIL